VRGRPSRPRCGTDAVGELISAAGVRAGLARAVTAHQLRHACGSNLLDAGGALDEAQDILGHATPSATQVYLHPDPGRLRAAVDRVPSPRAQPGVTP
jgi:site-specific recombinase XerD